MEAAMRQDYPWERHWTPMGGYAGNSFYVPQEGTSAKTSELSSLSRFLVLLGGLGMGKTREIGKIGGMLWDKSHISLLVKASELDSSPGQGIKDTPEWKAHEETGEDLTLLIDGIDEVLPYHPNFLESLCFFFRNHCRPGLSVVLGMRSGVWQGNTHKALFDAWNTTEEQSVYELRPLAVADIETYFAQNGCEDATDFIDWVHEKDAATMARVPLYLEEVVKLWRRKPEERPSIHELRDTQIRHLLRENPYRTSPPESRTSLNPDRIEALAEVIAVHSILSGRPKFVIGDQEQESADRLDLMSFLSSPLDGEWRNGSSKFAFTTRDIRAVMERALFRRVSASTDQPVFDFDHHSFAERLAGRVISRQPLSQQIRLLGNCEGSRIVPQMQPLTALLAPSNPPLANWLLEKQPKVLLASDATEFDPDERAQIVKRALHEIESSDASYWISHNEIDAGFTGSEVARELAMVIEDKSQKPQTRTAAMAIAARCPNIGIVETLWKVIDDSTEETYARQKSLDAWLAYARMDVGNHLHVLWQIASGEKGTGKAHDRADALRVLLKSGVPVREILTSLPRKDENLIGSLEMLENYEIPKRIRPDDLGECFDYLNSKAGMDPRWESDDKIWNVTYRLAFDNLSVSPIGEKFANHWWITLKKWHVTLGDELKTNIGGLSVETRRTLIEALMASKELPEDSYAYYLPLERDDYEWVVGKCVICDEKLRQLWMGVAKQIWFDATIGGTPEWLASAYETGGDEFRGIFPVPRRGRGLGETISRFHQAAKLRFERRRRKWEEVGRNPKKTQTRAEYTEKLENMLRDDPKSGWVVFTMYAFRIFPQEEEKGEGKQGCITGSPGWATLPEEARANARSAARLFLETERSEYESGMWSNWLEAAYQAIDLLHDDIAMDEAFGKLVATNWNCAVLYHFNDSEDRHQQLVKLMKTFLPEKVRGIMSAEIRRELETSEHCMSFRQYGAGWDNDDSDALATLLTSQLCGSDRKRILRHRERMQPGKIRHDREKESHRARSFLPAFHFLANADLESAKSLVLNLCRAPASFRKDPHPAYPLMLICGILHFPHLWDKVWPVIQAHNFDVLRQTFDILIPHLDREYFKRGWADDLDGGQLGLVYLLYDRLFPVMPEHQYRDGCMTLHDHRQEFEQRIWRQLESKGAFSGIEFLIRRLGCDKRRESLRWYLGTARRKADEMRWAIPTAKEIGRWLLTKDAVFVRTGDDLLAAVMVSLERFQDSLGIDGRCVLDCWERQDGGSLHMPAKEEDLSARLSWHLESDLGKVIVFREGEIRVGYKKNRTDIEIHCLCEGRKLTVILEHKRAHNTQVTTGMKEQLIDRYMTSASCDHGIYLVSWFDGFEKASNPIRNQLAVTRADEAMEKLSGEAEQESRLSGKSIRVFILDCVKDGNMPSDIRP